jgi:uncharacterized delta-60 repeat protein
MKSILLIIITFSAFKYYAQSGALDTSFNTFDVGFDNGIGTNNEVFTSVIQPNGKILLGGEFTTYNGILANNIVRLNIDGSIDTTFVTGTGFENDFLPWDSPYIKSIALQNDGKIIVGGFFSLYNGTPSNCIIRLEENGAIDTTFLIGTGADNPVFSISLQADGKIILGGGFTSINGVGRGGVVRLNNDGTIDFSSFSNISTYGAVFSTIIQPDGKIILAGNFNTYAGNNVNHIVRLHQNGSHDISFNYGVGPNNEVLSAQLQPDGKIVIGGAFNAINLQQQFYIARLNSNGTIDPSFDAGIGTDYNVNTVNIQPDGKIIIGGQFETFDGLPTKNLLRLNTDGSNDLTFDIGNIMNYGHINATSIQSDGKIIICGHGNIENKFGVHRVLDNGIIDVSFNTGSGANKTVNATVIQPNGKIIIAGDFTTFNGMAINRIIRLESDGTIDATFDSGSGANLYISAVALQPDGKIIIGGGFTEYNGTLINKVCRLNSDGTIDSGFNIGTGINNVVADITIQPDGKIILVGNFTNFNGTSRKGIVRLNDDGSIDTTFDPGNGASAVVRAVAIQADGKIIIGGDFTTFNSNSYNRIVRLNADGSLDPTFTINTGFNNLVQCITLQPDGKILVGGQFTFYNGANVKNLARLNTDGTIDASFSSSYTTSSIIRKIVVQQDNKIVIGGYFSFYSGISRNNILRLNPDGTLDNYFHPGSGANWVITSLAIQPDANIIIGGSFTAYDGIGRNRVARIFGECNQAINHIDVINACEDYTWIDGITYTSDNFSATYTMTSFRGCDSIVSLNLSIFNTITFDTIYATVCDQYTWSVNGQNYNSTGVYTSSNVCHTDVLNLTVNNTTNIENVTACNNYYWPYNGQTYYGSGVWTETSTNVYGCTHFEILNLTINSVNTNIYLTISSNVISVQAQASAYQWLDCNANFDSIIGATSQSYSPTQVGSYAVEITQNGCIDTTECVGFTFANILENDMSNRFQFYPNPTQNNVEIDIPSSGKIEVLSMNNHLIFSEIFTEGKHKIALNHLANGIYIIRFINDYEIESKKLVVER